MSKRTISKKFLLVSFAVLVPAIGQLVIASPAHTQEERPCTYEGRTYPPGSTLGPYTCVDGEWQ